MLRFISGQNRQNSCPHGANILARRGRQWMNEWMNESVQATRTNGLLGQNSLFAGGNRSPGTFQKDSKSWLTCCGLLKGTVWGQGDGRTAFGFEVSLSINPQDSDSMIWEQYQGPWSKGPGKRWAGPPPLCPPPSYPVSLELISEQREGWGKESWRKPEAPSPGLGGH